MEVKEKDKIIETNEENNLVIYDINKQKYEVLKIFGILASIFILLLLITFLTFSFINLNNDKIITGVHIKGIDVSGLSKEEAKQKVLDYIDSSIPEEITLTHNDFQTSLSTSQLSLSFNIDEAVDIAYQIGRSDNVFQRNFRVLAVLLSKVDIDPGLSIDKEQLKYNLQDISNKLPDKIIESSYYIEDNNLIITKGSEGYIVNVEDSANYIINNITNLELDNPLELITIRKSPTRNKSK